MTTQTHFITELETTCDELDQQQIKKLVETYCLMYNWGCHEALTDCLTTLCEQKGFTTDYAIERLNNMNDEYMEDR